MTAIGARTVLDELTARRRHATVAGERVDPALRAEIESCRAAYVGLAVSEIASLRGELWGRQAG